MGTYLKVLKRFAKKGEEKKEIPQPTKPKPVIPIDDVEGWRPEDMSVKPAIRFSRNNYFDLANYLADKGLLIMYDGTPAPDRTQNRLAGNLVGLVNRFRDFQPDASDIEKKLGEFEAEISGLNGDVPKQLRFILDKTVEGIRKDTKHIHTYAAHIDFTNYGGNT